MSVSRAASWLLCLALVPACQREKPQDAVAAPSASLASVSPPRVVASSLGSPTAFELVADARGLRLLWAREINSPEWLLDAELSDTGALRGRPRTVSLPARTLGKVTDLAAAVVGEELALAWLEQGPHEARAVATFTEGAKPAQLLDLGAAALTAESARGNLGLVAETERGRALVMWRGLEAPCVAPERPPCTGFTFRRLRPGGAEPSGLPLSVPVPCAAHSVQLLVSPGHFHYGVCTRDGAEPITTVFSIQYDPEYARAEPLLKGCTPLGAIDAQGKPWLLGDCRGKRRAVPIPKMDEKVESEPLDAMELSCTPERAELRQGRFNLSLQEPRAGLESLLPPRFVPSGGRAGWTGHALVVAYVEAGRLETRSYACRGGKLLPS